MKNIIAFILIVTSFLVFPFASFGDNNSRNDIDAIAAGLFERIYNSNFDEAAKLFHYPTNMSQSERYNEGKAVAQLLKVIQKEFGKPTNIRPLQEGQFTFYVLSVGSVDIPYWQQHPDVLRKTTM